MLTTDSCTLYLKNGGGFDRFFVPCCHWQERKADNVLKSGMTSADGVTVYILSRDVSRDLSTLLASRKTAAEDMIVYGACPFVFDNSTPQRTSESLRALHAAFDVHTVMSLDKLLYGAEELRHFKISAR